MREEEEEREDIKEQREENVSGMIIIMKVITKQGSGQQSSVSLKLYHYYLDLNHELVQEMTGFVRTTRKNENKVRHCTRIKKNATLFIILVQNTSKKR